MSQDSQFKKPVSTLLAGEIKVESEMGVGSTFTVWLPVQQPKSSYSE